MTWRRAQGRENWSFAWTPPAPGMVTIRSRATDDSGNIEDPGAMVVLDITPDVTSPVLSGVHAVLVSGDSAQIRWTSNEPADSEVEFGSTTGYGSSTPLDPTLTRAHAVSLEGLTAESIYHYKVKSRDAGGNLSAVGRLHIHDSLSRLMPMRLVPP